MAKAPAKPEVAATETPAPKKSKLMIIIVVILVLVLLIVAALVGVLLLIKGNKGGGDNAPAAAPAVAPQAQVMTTVDLSKPPVFVQLDTFTVNLTREESDHYLQAVIVLRVADAKVAAQLPAFMPEIRHRTNLLLSSKKPSEVATMEGREALAQELLIQINEAVGAPAPRDIRPGLVWGPVHGVLFNSFIVQ